MNPDPADREPLPCTPTLERMKALEPTSQAIGGFIAWMGENGYSICEYDEDGSINHGYNHTRKTIEQLLADYFDIDLKRVEAEKRALLGYLAKVQKGVH